jgi:hypothetical protein
MTKITMTKTTVFTWPIYTCLIRTRLNIEKLEFRILASLRLVNFGFRASDFGFNITQKTPVKGSPIDF